MRIALVAVAVALAGCQETAELPAMPWLHGLSNAVVSEGPSATASRRLPDVSDLPSGCGADAYRGVELTADVTPDPGPETIVASFANGVVIYDREEVVVASSPGYRCAGSSDAIDAIAAGHAYGDRTIVLAGTSGGRMERDTWVGLFRLGAGDRVEPAFAAVVEQIRGDEVTRGDLRLLPHALLYRPPGGVPMLYMFDPVAGAYLVPGALRDEGPHEPPVAVLR